MSENTLTAVRERMYAFCFPNTPVTEAERQAFEQAVWAQYSYEQDTVQTPKGVKGFRLGEFEMTLADRTGPAGAPICPEAYGLLLRHGLLYRGVEGNRR